MRLADRFGWPPDTFLTMTCDEIEDWWEGAVAFDEARAKALARIRRSH